MDLAEYQRLVSGRWPDLNRETVSQMAVVGHLFGVLASIDWASQSPEFPVPEKPVAQLQVYLAELDRLINKKSPGLVGA